MAALRWVSSGSYPAGHGAIREGSEGKGGAGEEYGCSLVEAGACSSCYVHPKQVRGWEGGPRTLNLALSCMFYVYYVL